MPTTATHVWKPSVARTITLDAFVPVPRGAIPNVPAMPSWPLKDPADLLDYQFDIAPALIANDGDAIGTLDISVFPANPGDLMLTSATADGSRAVVWLGGGQPGTTYTVTLTIGTQAGRTIARSVLLPVAALSAPPVEPDGLTTDTGAALVDQNGNPILTGS
jgi:hypothetical protein